MQSPSILLLSPFSSLRSSDDMVDLSLSVLRWVVTSSRADSLRLRRRYRLSHFGAPRRLFSTLDHFSKSLPDP